MKVKFFGGPWHRKKRDVPTPLQYSFRVAEYDTQDLYHGSLYPARTDIVNVKYSHYHLMMVPGDNTNFYFYVHDSTSVNEILKKALT